MKTASLWHKYVLKAYWEAHKSLRNVNMELKRTFETPLMWSNGVGQLRLSSMHSISILIWSKMLYSNDVSVF